MNNNVRSEEQFRQLLLSVGVPVVTFVLFLFAWSGASAGIKTSLGTVPGPAQVLEQVRSLAYEHTEERKKEAEFYKAPSDKFIDKIEFDAHKPNEYLKKFAIGRK